MPESNTDSAENIDSTEAFDTMVIRAWVESGHTDRFRARLSFTSDSGNTGSTLMTSDTDRVIEAVREWIANVQATGERSEGAPSDSPDL
jgi:hypothetical protein